MKKRRKRKKSSARRGPDTSEEESDMESKVCFFLPLKKKVLVILNVPLRFYNIFFPRRKREE